MDKQNAVGKLIKEAMDVVDAYVEATNPASSKGDNVSFREGLGIANEVLDLRRLPDIESLGDDFLRTGSREIVEALTNEGILKEDRKESNVYFVSAIQSMVKGIQKRREE